MLMFLKEKKSDRLAAFL